MIRRPPRSTRVRSSAASDVYKRQQGTPSQRVPPVVAGQLGHSGQHRVDAELLGGGKVDRRHLGSITLRVDADLHDVQERELVQQARRAKGHLRWGAKLFELFGTTLETLAFGTLQQRGH